MVQGSVAASAALTFRVSRSNVFQCIPGFCDRSVQAVLRAEAAAQLEGPVNVPIVAALALAAVA
jgi:hypothetical protein